MNSFTDEYLLVYSLRLFTSQIMTVTAFCLKKYTNNSN